MASPKGIILLKGKVENITPLHIGSGSDDRTDMDILLGSDGLPYIPATAFVGVLLHSIKSSISPERTETEEWKRFWGGSEINKEREKGQGTGYQSHFQASDLMYAHDKAGKQTFNCVIRDGIKIDNTRGIVEARGKYDYELLDRGAVFDLKAEFLFGNDDREFVEKMVSTIISGLKRGNISIGKKTNSGFGQIRLLQDTITLYFFDFKKKEDALAWLFQDFSKKAEWPLEQLPAPITRQSEDFRINAVFQLKNSLMIRSIQRIPNTRMSSHCKPITNGSYRALLSKALFDRELSGLQKPSILTPNRHKS